MDFLQAFSLLSKLKTPHALCTVVAIKGSTPRKIGCKMIVIDDDSPFGKIHGTIGGGAIEHHIRKKALEAIRAHKSELLIVSLRNELAMCCGGEMTVFIEPSIKYPSLYIFGAGHISQALTPLACELGFKVLVIDERSELLNYGAFNNADKRSEAIDQFFFSSLSLDEECFIVVATHDHALDQKIIENILNKPFNYLGLIGSMRKSLMTKKRLKAKGFKDSLIAKIQCPAGLDIYAETPLEIALSILVHLISIKNKPLSLKQDGTQPSQYVSAVS